MVETPRLKTIFCDIDGTLIFHSPPTQLARRSHSVILLEGTLEKLEEWDKKGYNIILTTGRKESMRHVTVQQLSEIGILYDQLIMGIGGGDRYLINDRKPNKSNNTAHAINLTRNKGIKEVDI